MNSIKKFTSSSEFNDYILSYMLKNKLDNAYVSLRYGYTEKELEKEVFKIQVCGICRSKIQIYGICRTDNFYKLQWWLNWWEGQEFIELQRIISPEMVRLLSKFEDAELLGKLTKENLM